MREIQLSPTLIGGSKEQPRCRKKTKRFRSTTPPARMVIPQIAINVQQGLAKLYGQPSIDARGDTEGLTVRRSDYAKARLRQMMASTNCVLAAY